MSDEARGAGIVIEETGTRVDAALAGLLPDLGLRARRRLADAGMVLVNGRPARSGWSLRRGDVLSLKRQEQPPVKAQGEGPGVRVIAEPGGYVCLAKPAGLHSVRLEGGGGRSLEDVLPRLFPDEPPVLLQRLDFETSGIVCAARTEEQALSFRSWEREGRISKRYVCVLEGRLETPARIAKSLVSDGGGGVRVLEKDAQEPWRETSFAPLGEFVLEGRGLTLAGVVIHRGFRHQIRAHAAALGHPLFGDARYGSTLGAASGGFFLHHGRMDGPFGSCTLLPAWNLEKNILLKAAAWLGESGTQR